MKRGVLLWALLIVWPSSVLDAQTSARDNQAIARRYFEEIFNKGNLERYQCDRVCRCGLPQSARRRARD